MTEAHRFERTVLREYDIRGIVGQTLSVADARAVGRAFGTAVVRAGGRKVALGRDGRLSSPELSQAVAAGLTACGLQVTDVGLGPTPMLYFTAREFSFDGGVMVTGSHNPAEYNGFKMMLGKASFWGKDIQALGRGAAAGDYANGTGAVSRRDVFDEYVARLLRDYKPGRELNVVWDAGNGAAGAVMTSLTAKLPGRHTLLNERIDGRFPAHHPDPTVAENLR